MVRTISLSFWATNMTKEIQGTPTIHPRVCGNNHHHPYEVTSSSSKISNNHLRLKPSLSKTPTRLYARIPGLTTRPRKCTHSRLLLVPRRFGPRLEECRLSPRASAAGRFQQHGYVASTQNLSLSRFSHTLSRTNFIMNLFGSISLHVQSQNTQNVRKGGCNGHKTEVHAETREEGNE